MIINTIYKYSHETVIGLIFFNSSLVTFIGSYFLEIILIRLFTSLPLSEAHEAHIIKTAQRIEELNTWVSQTLEPWECLKPYWWYDPKLKELSEGIALYFTHTIHDPEFVHQELIKHVHDHEILELVDGLLYFQRC